MADRPGQGTDVPERQPGRTAASIMHREAWISRTRSRFMPWISGARPRTGYSGKSETLRN